MYNRYSVQIEVIILSNDGTLRGKEKGENNEELLSDKLNEGAGSTDQNPLLRKVIPRKTKRTNVKDYSIFFSVQFALLC